MPKLAHRDNPETIATGTATIKGQGVATPKTANAQMDLHQKPSKPSPARL